MRIVFLACDDEYAGAMQRYLYAANADWIVGSVISSCTIYRKTFLQSAVSLLKASGFRYPLEMVRVKLLRKLNPAAAFVTPSKLAAMYGVETFRCPDINAPDAVARLSAWKPDIIISTNFNHYIGSRVRRLPSRGTWNLHKSKLPDYRGMAPGFYALLDGRTSVGATLHVVDKGIDTGPVLVQADVPVAEGDTVFSLSLRIADTGGMMLDDYLSGLSPDAVSASAQPDGDFRNFSYPRREDIRLFRKKGLRFI